MRNHELDEAGEQGGAALRGSQSVRRALDLLSLLASWDRSGGLSLSAMADESGLTRPTVHRLVAELVNAGYVEQGDDKRYRLGTQSHTVGRAAEHRHGLKQQTHESVVRIAKLSEDSAFVSVRSGTHSVCLHREEGAWPVRSHVLQAGDRHPLGIGAAGLALLAAVPRNVAASLIAANEAEIRRRYPQITRAYLLDKYDETRQNGFALNEGMVVQDSWGIAVVVPDAMGEPTLSLSIAAVASRMTPERQPRLVSILREEARRINNQIKA
ncbi:IclR family transcriptional regulator [Rhodococcus sp. JS3073]|uniref:IclR family transcriptional regulator n=1 Tax=Rhodococcus sp. JS3073 TaxID=3002901 RepID=UPI003FA76BE7